MKSCYYIFVLIFLFFLLNISTTEATLPGDLNEDHVVGYEDLVIFAAQWLTNGGCSGPNCADLYADDFVDFSDFSMLAQDWQQMFITLAINEFMASNSSASGIADPQVEYEDWIEIYNFGTENVNMSGMHLTDDLDDPTKWQIPCGFGSQTTISAGGFLLIWADEDVQDGPLHADFKLSKDGEHICLFDTDGSSLIDSITFGAQTTDISYGRYPDGNDDFRFFATPTPMAENNGGYLGAISKLYFSHERDFYNSPFNLTIACPTPQITIYYTLDGSEPVDNDEPTTNAIEYTSAISISSTTCIRAAAVKPGWKPTDIVTSTYIIIDDIITQSSNGQAPGPGWPPPNTGGGQHIDYGMDPDVVNDQRYADSIDDALLAIPSISLVTNLEYLFDPDTGIYMNAMMEGRDWERPCSVELINSDDTEDFQVNAGLRIRGGWSRHDNCPKHAFRLFFRGEYGCPKLKYALFGQEGADEFDKVDLRTAQNYSWSFKGSSENTFVRDVFSRDLQGQLGQPYTRSRFYHLYINGQYWGLYQTQERAEAYYGQTYFGGERADYDVVKADGGPTGTYKAVATDGNLGAYVELWDLANQLDDATGMLQMELYQKMQGNNPDRTRNPDYNVLLDVDNLIDFMLCTFYVGDRDCPISDFLGNDKLHNFFSIYNRNKPDGFKFFRHDAEHTLDTGMSDRTGPYTVINEKVNADYFNPQTLHQWLVECPDYRMRFADRAYKHMFNSGPITEASATATVTTRAARIDLAIIAESARWGDAKHANWAHTKDDDWAGAVNEVKEFFVGRVAIVLNQFRSKDWYPDIDTPLFYVNGEYQHDGQISPSDLLSIGGTTGTIYYTLDGNDIIGSPPQTSVLIVEGSAKKVLVPTSDIGGNWTGGSEPYDQTGWLSGTGGVGYERSSGYEAYFDVDVESEMYGKNATCYIRIPFTVDAVDLPDFDYLILKARYDDGFVAYINGTEIARANAPTNPQWNSCATANHNDSASVVFEEFDISDHLTDLYSGTNILAIHGLNISTTSSDFLISVELHADESQPVPNVTSSAVEYTGPLTLSESTRVKTRAYSSTEEWSALNEATFSVGPVADNLRITEIMYHPPDPNDEFIELKNIGSTDINLNLVKFTDGIDFTFPSITLPGGNYVVVVRNQAKFSARYPGFSGIIAGQYSNVINNAGERIELADALGQTILNFRFKDGWYPITDGDDFSLNIIDPTTLDPNSWEYAEYWQSSSVTGGTPGAGDTGHVASPGDIVINELMTHTNTYPNDWIELYNTTDSAIDITGWFLSDDPDNFKRYQIGVSASVTIQPYSYIVFTQDDHFGNPSKPGSSVQFALSELGETVYLSSGSGGELAGGFCTKEDFKAAEDNVTFGRYEKSATAAYDIDFVAMTADSYGAANYDAKVGPVVITEIMYHPASNNYAEYVEIKNISGTTVPLTDWLLTDEDEGIEYYIPSGTSLNPGQYLILTKNKVALNEEFTTAAVTVLEWVEGRLSNAGEKIELSKPGTPEPSGFVPYIRVDRVNYSDGSHGENFRELGYNDPWPTAPDGTGQSLQRVINGNYGNDVANWTTAAPTPGEGDAEPGSLSVDLNMDDSWMYQNLSGSTKSNLTATASVISDPAGNSGYSYIWKFILPVDVTVESATIGGGGASDTSWNFAAPNVNQPQGLSDSGQAITVRVTVTGDDFANTGQAQAQFGIALLGDVNNETNVNIADRSIINAFWQTGSAGSFTLRDCDLNCDGTVNVADRSIANAVWQGQLGQNSVTEPCPLR